MVSFTTDAPEIYVKPIFKELWKYYPLNYANRGYDLIDADPPVYESFTVVDGDAFVKFKVGEMGLSPVNIELEGFELAGEDGVFYPAKGRVYKDKQYVIVGCPEVPDPVAVRYGIPASPFRSDNWE